MDASSLAHARAVLFDLDGTLLDTLEDLGRSTNTVLAREGFPLHTLPAYKQFVGEGITMLVRRAVPKEKSGDEALVGRLVAALRKEYTAHCMDATHAYGGTSELLAKLGERGIAIAVLSNKPEDMVQKLLKHYFFTVSFDAVAGAGEAFPRKPDPAGALDIARRLRIVPEDFVFLGDSKTDMETATAAGMYPVGALWGFRDADELLAYGAKALIKHPSELIALLNR
jgi:phosphoglycolate phosphatase